MRDIFAFRFSFFNWRRGGCAGFLLVAFCLVCVPRGATAAEGSMHPAFRLLDGKGESVLKANTPVSTTQTCGGCHDVRYIIDHTYHGGRGNQKAEMNCFVCHLSSPDNSARVEESRNGRGEWVATATLGTSGAVKKTADGWKWNDAALAADGMVGKDFPRPVPPSSSNCGLCHGQVHKGNAPLVAKVGFGNRMTELTGQIFASQRMKDSGVNLANKDRLALPWDIHAERLLECRNCHYSPNNPAYSASADGAKPAHLSFESRKVSPGEFLMRPDHNFVRGQTMRRCESCHEAEATHTWLPYTQRHLQALSCEACHVPKAYAPARQQVDGTVIDPSGNAIVSYRGVIGPLDKSTSLVTGFDPVLLPRKEPDGSVRLTPHNLVASWYWVAGEPAQRVQTSELKKAFLDGVVYHADILAALDNNHDGKLDAAELRLTTPQKVDAVRRRLDAVGMKNPRIVGTVQPYSLNHGVAGGKWATRDCSSCHAGESRTASSMALASYLPGGVIPTLASGRAQFSGQISSNPSGELTYRPAPAQSGRYVIGHDRWIVGDVIGLLAVVSAVLGILGHGSMRILTARKRGKL